MNNIRLFKNTFVVASLLTSIGINGQEKPQVQKDTLRTESVTVIKTFNPTINDAFKIETQVNEKDFKEEVKKVSDFRIQSVPVASTFVPQKAKSLKVKKQRKELPPQDYATLAGGNFGNIEAEAFVSHKIDRDATISALLLHQSSQGGIDEVRVDDFYYDTGLQLAYSKEDRKTPWEVYFEAQHQLYNWYGIPNQLPLTSQQLSEIDPSHTFIDLNAGGDLTLDNDIFKNVTTQIRYFFDDQESKEINFTASTNTLFSIQDYELKIPVLLDVLSGSFNQEAFLPKTDYQFINFGVQPSVNLSYNEIEFRLGASAYISSDLENSETNFFVYPNLLASYQFKEYGVSVFGGVTGGLTQNTYHEASANNPFVAPTLTVVPTSEQFNAFAGIQGNIASQLNYKLKVSYNSEQDKPLFQNTPTISNAVSQANYGFNNSFSYVYADVNTGSLSGSVTYNMSSVLELSLTANAFVYNTSGSDEAWNLPNFTAVLNGNYKVNEKLSFDSQIFYTGSRLDLDGFTNTIADLEGFVDVNIGANYKITKNWNAFLKGKNLTNQNYERWLNFPVQSAQGLIGVRYLFDYK